jgi:ubiquinone/menaquinone biosynthesis C-methylase UbiE
VITEFGIAPGMKIADFGAGSGAYVFPVAEALAASGAVYAIDVQKDLLRKIKNEAKARGLETVEILWGDLEVPHGTKLADETIDLVIMSNALFQLKHKQTALAEAFRVLRTSGRLALIDWSDSFRGLGPVPESVVKRDEGLALATGAGFVFTREIHPGGHHWGLLLRKPKQGHGA